MSSGIIGMQRLSRYLQASVTIWESFYVIRNYWNAAFVTIFTSIYKDSQLAGFHASEVCLCMERLHLKAVWQIQQKS